MADSIQPDEAGDAAPDNTGDDADGMIDPSFPRNALDAKLLLKELIPEVDDAFDDRMRTITDKIKRGEDLTPSERMLGKCARIILDQKGGREWALKWAKMKHSPEARERAKRFAWRDLMNALVHWPSYDEQVRETQEYRQHLLESPGISDDERRRLWPPDPIPLLQPPQQRETPQQEQTPPSRVFRKDGGAWRIRFGGAETTCKDSKGARIVHYLLKNPRAWIPATFLSRVTDTPRGRGNAPEQHESTEDYERCGLTITTGDSPLEVSSPGAKQNLIQRLKENARARLQAEANGNLVWIAELDEEKAALEREYRSTTNIHDRPRMTGGTVQKAFTAVKKNIRRFNANIEATCPRLGFFLKHLDKSIRTSGDQFQYAPDRDSDWDL